MDFRQLSIYIASPFDFLCNGNENTLSNCRRRGLTDCRAAQMMLNILLLLSMVAVQVPVSIQLSGYCSCMLKTYCIAILLAHQSLIKGLMQWNVF